MAALYGSVHMRAWDILCWCAVLIDSEHAQTAALEVAVAPDKRTHVHVSSCDRLLMSCTEDACRVAVCFGTDASIHARMCALGTWKDLDPAKPTHLVSSNILAR